MRRRLVLIAAIAGCWGSPAGPGSPAGASSPVGSGSSAGSGSPAGARSPDEPAPPRAGAAATACRSDADCTLTWLPETVACCASLCRPRAIHRADLAKLEARHGQLLCPGSTCPPTACSPPPPADARCRAGACIAVER